MSTEAAFNELAREFFKQNHEARQEFCQWLLRKDEQEQEQEHLAAASAGAGGAVYGFGRHIRFHDDEEINSVNQVEEEEEYVDEDIDQNYIEHAMQQNETLKDFTAAQLYYIKEHPDGVNAFVSRLNISARRRMCYRIAAMRCWEYFSL
jgi:hypothetical protein